LGRDDIARDIVIAVEAVRFRQTAAVVAVCETFRLEEHFESPKADRADLDRLIRLSDFIGLITRKEIKALAGDYCAEIMRLRKGGRVLAARWNVCLAWYYTLGLIVRSPFARALQYLIKTFRG
jgi:hypothetical protein